MDDAASPVGRIIATSIVPAAWTPFPTLGPVCPPKRRCGLTGEPYDFLDRLAVLYDVDDDIAGLRALDATIKLLPLEASVSLPAAALPRLPCAAASVSCGLRHAIPTDARGFARPSRRSALGARAQLRTPRCPAGAGAPNRAFLRGLALRVTAGHVGVRVMGWLGGNTVDERIARVEQALRALRPSAVLPGLRPSRGVAGVNPFSAAVPYGLALALDGDGVAGAKSYFACESGDVLLDHVHGPVAQALELEGLTSPFDLLVGVMGSGWRRIPLARRGVVRAAGRSVAGAD